MLATPPEFPRHIPDGYDVLPDKLSFDPDRHLQLEFPERVWNLREFGYSPEQMSECASEVAISSPFRLLSDRGIKDLRQVTLDLQAHQTNTKGARNPAHLAGGVYRSRFLRDFCACREIIDHMSKISGTPLANHSMPSQQLYINYAPKDIAKAVDSWHYDGIGFDYVLMVSDPNILKGGNFEYFRGTKFEIAELFNLKVHEVRYGINEEIPKDRVIGVRFPAAGYAIFQQGNMIVHRAARLLAPAERITMVPGLVSKDTSSPDPTAKHDITGYNEPGIESELARHGAWLARAKLAQFLESAEPDESPENLSIKLRQAVSDVTATIKCLESKRRPEPWQ